MNKYLTMALATLFVAGCAASGRSAKSDTSSAATGAAPSDTGGATNATPAAGKTVTDKIFVVYLDKGSPGNHFAPSGWMGDYGDLKLDDGNREKPAQGQTAIKITYSGQAKQGANWAGIYWQNPPNNWGTKPGGYDLSKFKHLKFSARGAKGGEKAEFKTGGITGDQGDSDSATTGPMELTSAWKEYTIDLSDKNMSHIIGGFCWVSSKDDNPNGLILYLDNIRYE